nr:hypothetical protein B0A51_13294 [Rachicladosporium sp. CCFEE 5018]
MPYLRHLPIMPKETRVPSTRHAQSIQTPYPQVTTSTSSQRNAAIWSTADDEILLRARASGLNWQPIAGKHFPNKTANACRKRHERLIERRHVDDWDNQKLDLLAQEYLACRKEMWEILAARIGERWSVVEAKCMEKGLKSLQTTVRTAQRKAAAGETYDGRAVPDHNSDSGFLGSGSEPDAEPEMDVDEPATTTTAVTTPSKHSAAASWSGPARRDSHLQSGHIRSRSLPVPQVLPLYQPPPPRAYVPNAARQAQAGSRGISIQSVLVGAEPRIQPMQARHEITMGGGRHQEGAVRYV